jgi:hypothetical protein
MTMHATLEVWQGTLQTFEAGTFYVIKPHTRLVSETCVNVLSDVDRWLGTMRSTIDLPAAKHPGDDLLVVIYKLHNVNSRSSYTCAYLDDHAADDLRWNTLGGFVMHPDFTDQQDHQAYWIEVQSLERDTLMVMLG